MTDKFKLLVVDDETDFLELVATTFEETYEVSTTDNSKECLSLVDSQCFNLVLLDVNIGTPDGFELCKTIKEKHPKTDVMFISGAEKQEDIVKGYQLGAIDYLSKPVRFHELKEKVAVVLSIQNRLETSEESSRNAQKVAFSAMTDSSQLGRILEFMDTNISCKSIQEVAASLLETCQALELLATVYIKTPNEKAILSSGGDVSPIEALLIEEVRDQNRIIDFNQRTLYSDKHTSILIKNMPIDNPAEYGRFKDSLMTLVCGASSRVKAILNEQLLLSSRDSVQKALSDIEGRILEQTNLTTNLMKDFMVDMESTILVLGLSEDQEEYLLSLVDNHLKNVVEVVTSATETQSMLKASLNHIH